MSKHRGFSQIQENSGKFRVAVLIWKFLLAAETYGDSGSTTPNIVEFAVTHKLRYLNFQSKIDRRTSQSPSSIMHGLEMPVPV